MVNYSAPAEHPYASTPVTAAALNGIVAQLSDGFAASTGRVPVAEADIATLRTQLFGGSTRTYKPFFAARLSGNLSIPNNTSTKIQNADITLVKDTDSAWSTSNSYYVVPVTGYYRLTYVGVWASNATGTRFINITLNSTDDTTGSIGQASDVPSSTVSTHMVVHVADRLLTSGDILRWYAFQDSGAALNLRAGYVGNVNTAFTVDWIRPT